ncbi:hypothetical protein NSMM_820010 [Nitrosomonas mobilis]|uniref:Uncharacterized protein n=1 Tax=Nitrosomonas mobilis TaxID=51642 RepID=A0A1G5SI67_9PROT|nr:hypothetical protein NSMM_820010 [Nitrosomonas mobilis]
MATMATAVSLSEEAALCAMRSTNNRLERVISGKIRNSEC